MNLEFTLSKPAAGDLSGTADFWGTYYYGQFARESANGIPLRNTKDQPIGPPVTEKDWCLGAMEGTLVVEDAAGNMTTYNYAGGGSSSQASCRAVFPNLNAAILAGTEHARWRRAQGPYGDGAGDYVLVPYRTLAVDKTVVKLRTTLYIAAARGTRIILPNGGPATHDGYFFAADVGGAIKKNHFDFFLGTTSRNPFPFVKGDQQSTFAAAIVSKRDVIDYLAGLHTLS